MDQQPEVAYGATFNLRKAYAWTGGETLINITRPLGSVASSGIERRAATGRDNQLARIHGIEGAAKEALCELFCADKLYEQKKGIHRAFFLCKNIQHIKSLYQRSISTENLMFIYEEARMWPLYLQKDKKNICNLLEIQDNVRAFLISAPQPQNKRQELISYENHEDQLEEQRFISLEYFANLRKVISKTSKIAKKITTLFDAVIKTGFYWHFMSADERLFLSHAMKFNMVVLDQIDCEVAKILRIYVSFAQQLQMELTHTCKAVCESANALKYLMGSEKSAFKKYYQATSADKKNKFSAIDALFGTITFPRHIEDPTGLHEKIAIDSLKGLKDLIYYNCKHSETIVHLAEKYRREQVSLRQMIQIFATNIDLLNNTEIPDIYLTSFDITDKFLWSGTETLDTLMHRNIDPTGSFTGSKEHLKMYEGFVMESKKALCALPCSISTKHTIFMQKAMNLYVNIQRFLSCAPTEIDKNELQTILEEVRIWPLQSFTNSHFNTHFKDVIKAFNKLKNTVLAPPTHSNETVSQQCFSRVTERKKEMHLNSFARMNGLIKEVGRNFEFWRQWNDSAKALNIIETLCNSAERNMLARQNKKSLKLLDKIRSLSSITGAASHQRVSDLYNKLSELAYVLFRQPHLLNYIFADLERATSSNDDDSEALYRIRALVDILKTLPFPLEIFDPYGNFAKVHIEDAKELLSFFKTTLQYTQELNALAIECDSSSL